MLIDLEFFIVKAIDTYHIDLSSAIDEEYCGQHYEEAKSRGFPNIKHCALYKQRMSCEYALNQIPPITKRHYYIIPITCIFINNLSIDMTTEKDHKHQRIMH